MSDALADLFQELDGRIKADDNEAAIQVCDQILAAAPGDSDALHAKLVNLIELGKMEEALQVVESSPELAEICRFEWAYCLYSLSREKEALSLLMTSKGAEPSDARGLQLAAQILYRQGDYAKAADYFQKSEATGGPSAELSTNILAAQVSAGGGAAAADYAKRITEGGNSEAYSSQFELIYNYACAAIRINQLGLAERLLKRAIDLCRETLSPEEYTEEEIEVELGVLTAQSAYVAQCVGDVPSAEKAYKTLFSFKADLSPDVSAVAANNMLRIRGQRDFFDSWKKCKSNLSEAVARKTTPVQRQIFLSNAALLALHMNKSDHCKELLATLEKEFPSSSQPYLLRAALLQRAKQLKQCEESLEAAAASHPSPTAAILTLAQLHLQAKDVPKALATLRRADALLHQPGMVGTLVSLHEGAGQAEAAAACFDGATEPALLRAAAAFFSKHGLWPQAADAHKKLLASNPRDFLALAGLVIATSHYDPALANEHYVRLEAIAPPPDTSDAEMIDATELEQQALPRGNSSKAGGAAAEAGSKRSADDDGGSKRKRRRKKKPIYPKGFDPANPSATPAPDPERWLPKRERSYYRQRKKDKRAGISRGPQGSATGAARVDAKATTNIQAMSEGEKAKIKAEQETQARAEAAMAAARKKSKGKGKK